MNLLLMSSYRHRLQPNNESHTIIIRLASHGIVQHQHSFSNLHQVILYSHPQGQYRVTRHTQLAIDSTYRQRRFHIWGITLDTYL